MPSLREILPAQGVSGPASGRDASAADFEPASSAIAAAGREASSSLRTAADSRRATGNALARAELGVADATGRLGESVATLGEQVYKADERAEVSDLHAKIAQGQADWAVNLEQRLTSADPADREFVPKFLQEFDKYSEKLSSETQTRGARVFAQQQLAQLRGHFFETAMKGQARIVGAKAKADELGALQASVGAVFSDPDGFALALDRHDNHLQYLVASGQIDAADAFQLQTQGRELLARNAMRGIINRSPEEARALLKSGKWDQFIGSEKGKLLDEIDQEVRSRASEERQKAAEAREARHQSQMENFNKAARAWADGKLRWRNADPSKGEIDLSSLDVGGSQIIHLHNLMKVREHEGLELKNDPTVFNKVWSMMKSHNADDRKKVSQDTLDSLIGYGIDIPHYKFLSAELGDSKQEVNEFLRGAYEIAKRKLVDVEGSLGGKDPDGPAAFQSWLTWFRPQFDAQIEKGKTAAELTAPDSPLITAIDQFRPSVRTLAIRKYGSFVAPLPLDTPAWGEPGSVVSRATGKVVPPPEKPAGVAPPAPPADIDISNLDLGGLRVEAKAGSAFAPAPALSVTRRKPGESATDFLSRARRKK